MQKIFRVNSHVPWPVHKTSVVAHADKIERGTRCPALSPWCYLDGRNGIIFGENVWMGPRCSIISMNHEVHDYKQYVIDGPIQIGKNSWIGAGVTILPGVQLAEHTVIAAGSVVTKSFTQPNIVIAGVPAKLVKEIGPYGTESSSSDGDQDDS